MTQVIEGEELRLTVDDRVRLERIVGRGHGRVMLWVFLVCLTTMWLIQIPDRTLRSPELYTDAIVILAIITALFIQHRYQQAARQALADGGIKALANVKRTQARQLTAIGLLCAAAGMWGHLLDDMSTALPAMFIQILIILGVPALPFLIAAYLTHRTHHRFRDLQDVPADQFDYLLPKRDTQ